MADLIKIDRNGTKYYQGWVTCDRCGGSGGAEAWKYTGWTCYKCEGKGKVIGKWVERTPEYQAKLDARRAKKLEAKKAQLMAEEAERKMAQEAEAKRMAEAQAQIEAQKAISQYVGEIGQRLTINVKLVKTAYYEQRSFSGYGMTTVYVYILEDENGNKFVWKTTGGGLDREIKTPQGIMYRPIDDGEVITVKGTVKEHSTYQGEKQTILTRCKGVA